MLKDPVFEVGQVVIATGTYMHQINEGKEYTVIGYQPQEYTPIFTWPAYVTVIGNSGTPVTGHTHRFTKKQN